MGQSDVNLIQMKQAERIVHVLIDRLNVKLDEEDELGITANPEELEVLTELVQRVLNPEFEDVEDGFESSNIASVAYDDVSAVLQVDFNSGSRYHYYGVELDKAEALLNAESKGKFFQKEIRKNYTYAQIA